MQEKFKKIFQFELRGMVTPDYKMRLLPTNCAIKLALSLVAVGI